MVKRYRLRRIVAFILTVGLFSFSFAESAPKVRTLSPTAAPTSIPTSVPTVDSLSDEQLAYYIYVDIYFTYQKCIDYIYEVCRMFEKTEQYKSFADWDKQHIFYENAIFDVHDDWEMQWGRIRSFKTHMEEIGLYTKDEDFDTILNVKMPKDSHEMYTRYINLLGKTNITNVIWAVMYIFQEIDWIPSIDTLENEYFNYAKSNMQILRKRNNELFSSLLDYYKDASNLLDYIKKLNASYLEIKAMVKEHREKYNSYEIDFDFLFGDMDYSEKSLVFDLRRNRKK